MSIISAGNTTTTAIVVTGDTTGNLVFTTGGANTVVLTLSNTQAATFANNVSIAGTTVLSNTATATAFIPAGSTVPSSGIFQPSANTIGFSVASTEVSRFDSSGNFCVGTTSAVGQINIVAPVNTKTEFYMLKNTQVEGHIGFKSSTDSNWYFNTGASLGAYGLYQANNGNSWVAVSDETLKTDLTPILDGINKVASLRSVTGRYTTDPIDKSRSFLIAQDVQKVLPEAVSIADSETGTLGLSYTDVIPLLVAAIKELKAEIDLLKGN